MATGRSIYQIMILLREQESRCRNSDAVTSIVQRTETVNASEPTLRVMTGMAIEKESSGQGGDIRVY